MTRRKQDPAPLWRPDPPAKKCPGCEAANAEARRLRQERDRLAERLRAANRRATDAVAEKLGVCDRLRSVEAELAKVKAARPPVPPKPWADDVPARVPTRRLSWRERFKALWFGVGP